MTFGPIKESNWLSADINNAYRQTIERYRSDSSIIDFTNFLRDQAARHSLLLDAHFDPEIALGSLIALNRIKAIIGRGALPTPDLLTGLGMAWHFFSSQLSQEQELAVKPDVSTGDLSIFRGGGTISFEEWVQRRRSPQIAQLAPHIIQIGNPYGTLTGLKDYMNFLSAGGGSRTRTGL